MLSYLCKSVYINYINARVATVQAVNIIDRQDKVVVVNVGGGGGLEEGLG